MKCHGRVLCYCCFEPFLQNFRLNNQPAAVTVNLETFWSSSAIAVVNPITPLSQVPDREAPDLGCFCSDAAACHCCCCCCTLLPQPRQQQPPLLLHLVPLFVGCRQCIFCSCVCLLLTTYLLLLLLLLLETRRCKAAGCKVHEIPQLSS